MRSQKGGDPSTSWLAIELLKEQDFCVHQRLPFLQSKPHGVHRRYVWPQGQPRLSLMYWIRARKPA